MFPVFPQKKTWLACRYRGQFAGWFVVSNRPGLTVTPLYKNAHCTRLLITKRVNYLITIHNEINLQLTNKFQVNKFSSVASNDPRLIHHRTTMATVAPVLTWQPPRIGHFPACPLHQRFYPPSISRQRVPSHELPSTFKTVKTTRQKSSFTAASQNSFPRVFSDCKVSSSMPRMMMVSCYLSPCGFVLLC